MKKKSVDVFNKITNKGIFPYQFAFTLLIPIRNIILSPKRLIRCLNLKKDYNVMEVGSGPGYFSTKIANFIPNGKLFLTDIQEEMLKLARKRLSRRRVTKMCY